MNFIVKNFLFQRINNKKSYWKLFFLFVFLILPFSFFRTFKSLYKKINSKEKIYKYEIYVNQDELVEIINDSEYELAFNFRFNEKFFFSTKHFIRSCSINGSINNFEKLFDCLTKILVHSNFHCRVSNPLTIINSTGYSLCDKQSAIYGLLCKKLDFEAFLLGLNGHVLCELYDPVTKKKILADVDHKHFFKYKQEFLSYKDIVENLELIDSVVLSLNERIANINSLSPQYKEFFKSINDNEYKKIIWDFYDTFLIKLPPKSKFVFPYFPNYLEDFFPYNTKAKLILKDSNKIFKIDLNSLVISKINGHCLVYIDNAKFHLPYETDILEKFLLKKYNSNGIKKVKIKPLKKMVEVTYLLNPVLTKLNRVNKIEVWTNNKVKIDKIKRINHFADIKPIHIQWLDEYSVNILSFLKDYKPNDTSWFFKNFLEILSYLKKKNILYDDSLSITAYKEIKKRLIFLDLLMISTNFKLNSNDFLKVLSFVVFFNNNDYRNIYLQNFKLIKAKKILIDEFK